MRSLCTALSFLLVINFFGYSQTEIDKTIFKPVSLNQTETIIINVRNYDKNVVGMLKDDLVSFDGKVNSVDLDEANNLLHITYNDKMLLEDMISVFDKHNINYLLNPKGSTLEIKNEEL